MLDRRSGLTPLRGTLSNEVNIKKHGVDFHDAKSVFYDEGARIIDDPDHSVSEDRFIIVGMDHKLRTLLVCHCYRDEDEVIRIISVRKATKVEAKSLGGKQ